MQSPSAVSFTKSTFFLFLVNKDPPGARWCGGKRVLGIPRHHPAEVAAVALSYSHLLILPPSYCHWNSWNFGCHSAPAPRELVESVIKEVTSETHHSCSKWHYANTGWGQASLNALIQKLDIKAAEKVGLKERDGGTGQKALGWGCSSAGCELSSRDGTRNRTHCEFHLVLPVCFCPKRTHLSWVLLHAWGDNREQDPQG